MPNVETVLRDHVVLQLDCIDRLYLNGYVPTLQRPDQVRRFFCLDRRQPILSPALLQRMTKDFVGTIHDFAERERIPIVRFARGQRKEDVARTWLKKSSSGEGVVFIGVAQEKVSAFRSVQNGPRRRHRTPRGGRAPRFSFCPNRGKEPNAGNVVDMKKPGTVSDSGLSEGDPIGT